MVDVQDLSSLAASGGSTSSSPGSHECVKRPKFVLSPRLASLLCFTGEGDLTLPIRKSYRLEELLELIKALADCEVAPQTHDLLPKILLWLMCRICLPLLPLLPEVGLLAVLLGPCLMNA